MDAILLVGRATIQLFLDAGIYVLFGFFVAGIANWLLPPSFFFRLMGGGRFRPVVAAAFLGVPLPLCSCSALPMALTLHKRGASRGATASFLVSEPENGIDSIAVTYGLMDGIMAVMRPIAGVISGIVAGTLVELFARGPHFPTGPVEAPACDSGCGHGQGASCSTGDGVDHGHSGHAHAHGHSHAEEAAATGTVPKGPWYKEVLGYAFGPLLDETSWWLMAGLLVSALISGLISGDFVERYLGAGLLPKLVIAFVGVPIYVCASSSTPVAASLIAKGMAPGTALVFLLAGPATNLGTMATLYHFFGAAFVGIYLGSIVVSAIGMGFAVDAIYAWLARDPRATIGAAQEFLPLWLRAAGAIVMTALLLRSMWRTTPPPEFRSLQRGFQTLTGVWPGRRQLGIAAAIVLVAGYLSTAVSAVEPGNTGFRRTLGRLSHDELASGFHLHAPWPMGGVEQVSLQSVERVEIGFRSGPAVQGAPGEGPDDAGPGFAPSQRNRRQEEAIVLTGDENLIDLTAAIHYVVIQAWEFLVNWHPEDVEKVIRATAQAALMEAIATENIDGIYTVTRRSIEHRAMESMNRTLAAYGAGLRVAQVTLLDVHAPAEVHAAFRDVASAMEDQHRIINEAEGYRVETSHRAAGEASRIVSTAEADRNASILDASGRAMAFASQEAAYSEAPGVTRERLYLELLERQLPGARKIIRPAEGTGPRVDLWQINTTRGVPGLGSGLPLQAGPLPPDVQNLMNERRRSELLDE